MRPGGGTGVISSSAFRFTPADASMSITSAMLDDTIVEALKS
jgi:hypothetical protein